MKQCHHDSDCRAGYECIDPRGVPWDGIILDDDQTQHICIGIPDPPTPDASVDYDAAVCQAACTAAVARALSDEPDMNGTLDDLVAAVF